MQLSLTHRCTYPTRGAVRLRCGLVIAAAVLFRMTTPLSAQPPDGDRQVLGVIFEEQHVTESALLIHRKAAAMPPSKRYEFLLAWVLPSPDHQSFRLALDFSPTHPPPPLLTGGGGSPQSASEPPARCQTGGELVSPALDLIETAAELKRLDSLHGLIEQAPAPDERQQCNRLALLGLSELARGNADRGAVHFEELFERAAAAPCPDFPGRWAETLALEASLAHPRMRESAIEPLYRILHGHVRQGICNGPPAWDRWVSAAAGKLLQTGSADTPLTNWTSVSRTTGWSRGLGMPCAEWRTQSGNAELLRIHDDEYLFYRLPLRGNFEVECDVTSFNWREMSLMVAGTWVVPVYDHVTFEKGQFGRPLAAGRIEPRLSQCDDWIRYRVVVRDRKLSTYLNGRLINTEPLDDEHDPWLAIRSSSYTRGAVRDVRITGNPIIPPSVRLSASPTLAGWSAYHGEPIDGDMPYWRHSDSQPGGELTGLQETWLSGQGVERLLQYCRPMVEDGRIEYEFYYRPGEIGVHPALDRRAFLIEPDGVALHWITDGVLDRTELSPLNRSVEPHSRRGPDRLPLRENDWNHVRLQLHGALVQLFLNETLICEVSLEPTNQRTFGLFHWADRTLARIRNIVWTGDWPRRLPAVEKQELAGEATTQLDRRREELTAGFDHDFSRDGVPDQLFRLRGPALQTESVAGRGRRLETTGSDGFVASWISLRPALHGDFDVEAEFEAFNGDAALEGHSGIWLTAITDDPLKTHASIFRGLIRDPGTFDRQIVQAEFTRVKPEGQFITWPAIFSEESTSGTLRLARRGNRLHCLFAEGDSPNFRLICTETIPTEPTLPEGLRLRTSTHSPVGGVARTTVIWKRLSIRTQRLSMGDN